MYVARFREAPASTHQALSTVSHGGLAILAIVNTIKGIIVRVQQKKLCDWLS